jgi:hypothetical protein
MSLAGYQQYRLEAQRLNSTRADEDELKSFKERNKEWIGAEQWLEKCSNKPPPTLLDPPILVSSLREMPTNQIGEDQEILFDEKECDNVTYRAYLKARPILLQHYYRHHLLLQLQDDEQLVIRFILLPDIDVIQATEQLYEITAYWLPGVERYFVVSPGVSGLDW